MIDKGVISFALGKKFDNYTNANVKVSLLKTLSDFMEYSINFRKNFFRTNNISNVKNK